MKTKTLFEDDDEICELGYASLAIFIIAGAIFWLASGLLTKRVKTARAQRLESLIYGGAR